MTERKTDRFLLSHEKEREKLKRQEEKLEAARKALARARASSADKHEKWHRYKLAYHDREAGYEGKHADARDELRRLPVWQYYQAVFAGLANESPISLVEAERAAVERNFDDLTAAANARYLERDQAAYLEALAKWQAHDRANPAGLRWRSKAATREQWYLIDRIIKAAGIDRPGKMTRGEAHDWIEANGGNPRYPSAEPDSAQPQGNSPLGAGNTAAGAAL